MNIKRVTVILANGLTTPSEKEVHFENVVFGTDREFGIPPNRTYQRTCELYIQRERKIEVAGKDPTVVRDDVAVFAEGQWIYVKDSSEEGV